VQCASAVADVARSALCTVPAQQLVGTRAFSESKRTCAFRRKFSAVFSLAGSARQVQYRITARGEGVEYSFVSLASPPRRVVSSSSSSLTSTSQASP
jgi:hypothetical protein